MQDSQQITPRILVTTDFSDASESAFYHGLLAAVARQARLTLLHTGSESRQSVPWERFPGVRETLTAWRLLPEDAPRTAVAERLNVGVAKMAMRDDDPRQGITEYLRKHPTDLLVMASEGRRGLARLFNPSVAETVSFLTKSHTLMLPKRGKHFVDGKTGTSKLKKVLCALDPDRDPRPTLAFLSRWLPALGADSIDAVLLQSPQQADQEPIAFANTNGLQWRTETYEGDLVENLIENARKTKPDLLIMNASSPLKLKGRMRGSRVDRVLQALKLPVLSVP